MVLLSAALVAAATWAYATSFAGVLVLDDVRAIARNPTIRTLWPPSTPLSPPPAATVSGRPVANLSFAINYALAPRDARDVFVPVGSGAPTDAESRFLRNVWGYHLANLLIHLGAGLTLFGVVRRTLVTPRLQPALGAAAPYLAGAVAVLWLVHPLQTASITYVVQRVEALAGLFYLLTLYAAIRAADGARRGAWTVAAVTFCALGMATKEVMVTAPITVWLWDRTFGPTRDGRARRPLLVGLAATWVVLAVLVWHERRGPSLEFGDGMVWRYLLTQGEVLVHYLRLAVVPSPLVFLYTWPIASSIGDVAPQAALVAGLVVLTAVGIVRRHPLGFAGAWFFLILAPSSSVLPIVTEVAAEHRMYLPLAAVVVLVVTGSFVAGRALLARILPDAARRARAGVALGALSVATLVVLLGTATRARNHDYRSEEALWRETVARQPDNQRARVAFGSALANLGRFEEAEAELKAAVSLGEHDGVAQGRLGAVLATQRKFGDAVVHLERALALRPDDIDAHRSLGLIYAMRGQDEVAARHFEAAVAVQDRDPVLLGRLAALLAESDDPAVKNPARALALAERSVGLTGRRDPMALSILAAALAASGRFGEAVSTAREGLALAEAQRNEMLVAELRSRAEAYEARQRDEPVPR